eukprot:6414799-Alexandrium_andersonii.AAC.1
MSASLVGSEMCIRDRGKVAHRPALRATSRPATQVHRRPPYWLRASMRRCLLYTSDAADDM